MKASKFAKEYFAFVSFPLAEFAFLRIATKHFIGFRPGWGNLTDYDLFVPTLTGLALYFFLLRTAKRPEIRLSPKMGLLNLFVVLCALGFAKLHLQTAWWLSIVVTFLTSPLVFFRLSFFLKNAHRMAVIPATLISISVVLQNTLFSSFWENFGARMSMPVCRMLQATLGKEMVCEVYNVRYLALVYPGTSLFIGRGCAGFDAFIFFTAVFAMFLVFSRNRFSFSNTLLAYLGGLFLMYWMNISRMVSIFLVAVIARNFTSQLNATNTAIELAHTHLGWIYYVTASYFYFTLLRMIPSMSPNKKGVSLRPLPES